MFSGKGGLTVDFFLLPSLSTHFWGKADGLLPSKEDVL
jgi:hypothetical protein